MTATLHLSFADGQSLIIPLDHVVEINVPAPSVEFAMNKSGKWTMRITKGMTMGKKLADDFLSVRKNVETQKELAERIKREKLPFQVWGNTENWFDSTGDPTEIIKGIAMVRGANYEVRIKI